MTETTRKPVCAWCLREIKVREGSYKLPSILRVTQPIRHGWKVQGYRQAGAYGLTTHSAACEGVQYPTLDLSPHGTRAHLAEIVEHRDAIRAFVAKLDSDSPPDLGFQVELRVWAAKRAGTSVYRDALYTALMNEPGVRVDGLVIDAGERRGRVELFKHVTVTPVRKSVSRITMQLRAQNLFHGDLAAEVPAYETLRAKARTDAEADLAQLADIERDLRAALVAYGWEQPAAAQTPTATPWAGMPPESVDRERIEESVEPRRTAAGATYYLNCRIPMVYDVGRGVLGGTTWTHRNMIGVCGVPLFDDDRRREGICRSCSKEGLDPAKLYHRHRPYEGAEVLACDEITLDEARALLAKPSWTETREAERFS